MNTLKYAAVLLLAMTSSCGSPDVAIYVEGRNIVDMSFNLYTANMGIHPDTSVLDDPNNPFSNGRVGPQTKWNINDSAGAVAAFYCWASMLIYEPTGEHQYYAAEQLREMVDTELVSGSTRVFVRDMALRAYQAVLDHFPASVSYLEDGIRSFPLAPLAYQAIIDMGGTVEGGWVLVETSSGKQVIQIDNDAAKEETP